MPSARSSTGRTLLTFASLSRGRWRRIALLLALPVFVLVNGIAYLQATRMTHWSGQERTAKPETLSLPARALVLLGGVSIPRPVNHRTPGDAGLAFETLRVANGHGESLEAWYVPAESSARALALAFHGHAACKEALIPLAKGLRELWLAESWLFPGSAASRYFDPYEEPARVANTDEAGGCRIAGLRKGRWALGPSPGPVRSFFDRFFSGRTREGPTPGHAFPAVGQFIHVVAGEQRVTLSLRGGQSIEGHVIDPEGRPAPGARITCRSTTYGGILESKSDKYGAFKAGILAEGEYALRASTYGSIAHGPDVLARSGERNVLVLLPSSEECTVRGHVRGCEPGEAVRVQAFPLDHPGWSAAGRATNGEFVFTRLNPGVYCFSAESNGGRFGWLTGVDVRPGIEPVLLDLRPGARLVVRSEVASLIGIQVYLGGVLVAVSLVLEGSSPAIVVPPGSLELRFFQNIVSLDSDWGQPSQTRTVSVRAGSEVEIVFP